MFFYYITFKDYVDIFPKYFCYFYVSMSHMHGMACWTKDQQNGSYWGLGLCSCDSRTLLWRHNEHDSVSNHQPHHCLLNRLFGHRSKKTSKLRVTGLCEGNSPGTGEFPAQKARNAENVSIWWRHHDINIYPYRCVSVRSALEMELRLSCTNPSIYSLTSYACIWLNFQKVP